MNKTSKEKLKAFALKNKLPILLLLFSALAAALLLFGSSEDTGKSSDNGAELKKSVESDIREMAEKISGSRAYVTVSIDCLYTDEYAQNDNGGLLQLNGKPVLIKSELPHLRGVTVVCKNGDDTNIRSQITQAVCCAYGINSNRVYVCSYFNK